MRIMEKKFYLSYDVVSESVIKSCIRNDINTQYANYHVKFGNVTLYLEVHKIVTFSNSSILMV